MAENHDIESNNNAHRHTRRTILGAAAAVGMLVPATPRWPRGRASASRPAPP
jgi:hypothetical protein